MSHSHLPHIPVTSGDLCSPECLVYVYCISSVCYVEDLVQVSGSSLVRGAVLLHLYSWVQWCGHQLVHPQHLQTLTFGHEPNSDHSQFPPHDRLDMESADWWLITWLTLQDLWERRNPGNGRERWVLFTPLHSVWWPPQAAGAALEPLCRLSGSRQAWFERRTWGSWTQRATWTTWSHPCTWTAWIFWVARPRGAEGARACVWNEHH